MSEYPAHIEVLRQQALRTSVEAYAIRARLVLSKGVERFGACPRCGGKDRFSLNTRKNVWNCRGCDKGGHDSIGLAMHITGLGFIPALEAITGQKADDMKSESAETRAIREKQIQADKDKAAIAQQSRERENTKYREYARTQGFNIWRNDDRNKGLDIVGQYLQARGIAWGFLQEQAGESDCFVCLRGVQKLEYVKKFDGENHVLYTGPAMLAAAQSPDGYFSAVHQTYLTNQSGEWKKATILHPKTNKPMPAKLVRGSQKGCAIRLYTPKNATRMVAGEGIETTLSVMAKNFEPDTAYWCLINLGNMAGTALRDAQGNIVHDQPNMDDDEAFVPPEWVKELVYLGDADAKTEALYQNAKDKLTRGCRRAMVLRPSLVATIAMAERGKDFNDMIQLNKAESINAE